MMEALVAVAILKLVVEVANGNHVTNHFISSSNHNNSYGRRHGNSGRNKNT